MEKKTYETPKLIVYGNVKIITQGSNTASMGDYPYFHDDCGS